MSESTQEPRYTLAEAEQIRRIRECRNNGHSWNVHASLNIGPNRITCDNCGWSGTVEMGERPAMPQGS